MFSSNTDIYVDKKIHNKQEERHPDKEPNIWHHGQVSCNRKYKTNPNTGTKIAKNTSLFIMALTPVIQRPRQSGDGDK